MRLNQLNLTRYGRFTDFSLSFGARPESGPDLHVVYGPNEAGKSTLLSGWLDLLFQIHPRSQMNFLHPYSAMQLGADLEIDGQVQQIVRVKKRDNSLLDIHGAPMGEAMLHGGLRGLDRPSYSAMFSLNGQTLVAGGESILASEGDLGQLLFSASAGLSDLATRLDAQRQDADDFLSASGRKGRLLELKSEFDQLGDRMKELDTAASEFSRLSEARDTARGIWKQACRDAETAMAQSLDLQRQIAALPVADRLQRFDAQIAEFGDLPEPPPGWVDNLPALDREQTETATRIDAATQAVLGLESELEDTQPEAEVLELEDNIAAADRLKPGYDTAIEDLPKRNKDRDAESGAIGTCLTRLGQSAADPASLVPKAGVLGSLRALIEQHSGVETALASAEQEDENARVDSDRATRRLKQAGGGAADPGGLAGLVARVRSEDPVGALERAEATCRETTAQLLTAVTALLPWTGDSAALQAVRCPEAGWLDTTRVALNTAERAAERQAEEVVRLTEEADQAEARFGGSEGQATVTLEHAAEARADRETSWSQHRAELTAVTADTFEQKMRVDDQITIATADQRARAEKATEMQLELTGKRQTLKSAEANAAKTVARLDELRQSLSDVVTGVSQALSADMTIETFGAWLARHDIAVDRAIADARAGRDLEQRKVAVERDRANLLAAMDGAGRPLDPDTGISVALEAAQSLLDRQAKVAALDEASADARQEVTRRERALETAQQASADWKDRWSAACAETWMAAAPPDVGAMRAILDVLAELQETLRRHADLDLRIRKMEDNHSGFTTAVKDIAVKLGMPGDRDASASWRAISIRLRAAEDIAKSRKQIQDKLKAAQEKLADLDRDAALHRQRIAEIGTFFGTGSWPDAREALTRAGGRADLVHDRDDCAADLCERMQLPSPTAALEQLQGLDSFILKAQAETLKTNLEKLNTDQQQAFADHADATREVEAVGGDNAVAQLAEERQTLLLEIAEGARAHLRHKLGILAVDHALRRYRDTHRSGMLERASEAFRIMSRDRYSGLAAQPDGSREVLVALTADGGSKEAHQLSDGTRAQLYLALRIAGYHEFARSNGPVPFIADDIMESFDNDRTAEALGLLSQMSETGQVIYLTHHPHVCEIAREVCSSVRIHELAV